MYDKSYMLLLRTILITLIFFISIPTIFGVLTYNTGNYNSGLYGSAECGDSICDSDETCSTCSADCGLCATSSSSNSGGGGGQKGVADNVVASETKTWAGLEEGTNAIIEVKNPDIGITNIEITLENTVSGVSKVEVAKLNDMPSEIKESVGGSVYQYLKITPTKINDNDIKSATVRFKVSKEWLNTNGIKEENVILYRHNNNEWKELPTTIIGSNDREVMYIALTPGFSVFAIGEKKKVIEEKPKEEQKNATEQKEVVLEMVSVVNESIDNSDSQAELQKNYNIGLIIAVIISTVIIFIGDRQWLKKKK